MMDAGVIVKLIAHLGAFGSSDLISQENKIALCKDVLDN